jgi:hypothetical protein
MIRVFGRWLANKADWLAAMHRIALSQIAAYRFNLADQFICVANAHERAVDQPTRINDLPIGRGENRLFVNDCVVDTSMPRRVVARGLLEMSNQLNRCI